MKYPGISLGVPFRNEDADFVGNLLQPSGCVAHVVVWGSIRSGHSSVSVPPVPELVGELVEAKPIELAIGLRPQVTCHFWRQT